MLPSIGHCMPSRLQFNCNKYWSQWKHFSLSQVMHHKKCSLVAPASAASPPPLLKRFIFIFMCEYMPHECRVCGSQKRVSDSPAARVTGSGELPHIGA